MHGTTTRVQSRARSEEPPADKSDAGRCACGRPAEGFDARLGTGTCRTCARLRADGGLEFSQGERGLDALERIADAQERQARAAEVQAGALAELVHLSMPGRNSTKATVSEYRMWLDEYRTEAER